MSKVRLEPPDTATISRLCACYQLAVADIHRLTDPHELWEQINWLPRGMWVVALHGLECVPYDRLAVVAHSRADVMAEIYNRHGCRWPVEKLRDVQRRAHEYMQAADPNAGTGILATSQDEASA